MNCVKALGKMTVWEFYRYYGYCAGPMQEVELNGLESGADDFYQTDPSA